jgi:hypothetical protein
MRIEAHQPAIAIGFRHYFARRARSTEGLPGLLDTLQELVPWQRTTETRV